MRLVGGETSGAVPTVRVMDRPFDLVLCRNVAFTYFDDAGQRATLRRIASVTAPGGALVIGAHEDLPAGQCQFDPWAPQHGVYRVR